jgi:phosphatidylinositol dimannoside acyltransferase
VDGRITALGYRAAGAIAQTLPEAVGERMTRAGAQAARRLMHGRREMVERHQLRVAPDRDAHAAAVGVFDSYAHYWYELLRLPVDVRRGLVAQRFRIDGHEHIQAGLAAGNGVIMALPHVGGWEYGAAGMASLGHRMLAVVEPIEPPELYDWFVDQRRGIGLDVVPLGPTAGTEALAALRANRVVCLLSDRDITGDGVEVEFFGERTTLPAGPATLAIRAGAALLPAAVYYEPGHLHHAYVQPALPLERAGRLREDVTRITQQLAHEFERQIRASPEQWHLMQPNWPSDRRSEKPSDRRSERKE